MDSAAYKKKILAVYEKCYGNIKVVCDMLQISRQTFYTYKRNDPEFAQALADLDPDEARMDFIEDKLIQKANEGDTAVLIFLAKTKCKKRGYVERTEHEHAGNVSVPVIFELDERFANKDNAHLPEKSGGV